MLEKKKILKGKSYIRFFMSECELPVSNPRGDNLKAKGFLDLELKTKINARKNHEKARTEA